MTTKTEEELQQAELDSLVNQTASPEAVTGEFQPKEEQPQIDNGGMSTADLVTPLLQLSFGLIASVKGEHWRLDDDTATEAGAEYARCLDHYFPEINAAPWMGMAMVSTMLLAPRMMMDRQLSVEKEAEQPASEKGKLDDDK